MFCTVGKKKSNMQFLNLHVHKKYSMKMNNLYPTGTKMHFIEKKNYICQK